MRQLRVFRIFLAVIFFTTATVFLFIGPHAHPMAVVSEKSQIILSSLSATIGATLVWLLITFLVGRVYCSTVCPIGSIADVFARLGRRMRRRRRYFSYKPAKPWGIHVLTVYILSLLIGITTIAFAIEPWNIFKNVAGAVRPEAVADTWGHTAAGAATGVAAGIIGVILIAVWAAASGRDFCTSFCPVGAALSGIGRNALMHIEIDPDRCTHCGKCENVCQAHCIRQMTNYVDNARCLRCFDCLAVCEEEAINFQINRNTPLTPLFRRRTRAGS